MIRGEKPGKQNKEAGMNCQKGQREGVKLTDAQPVMSSMRGSYLNLKRVRGPGSQSMGKSISGRIEQMPGSMTGHGQHVAGTKEASVAGD